MADNVLQLDIWPGEWDLPTVDPNCLAALVCYLYFLLTSLGYFTDFTSVVYCIYVEYGDKTLTSVTKLRQCHQTLYYRSPVWQFGLVTFEL